jgi:hypothetical protein
MVDDQASQVMSKVRAQFEASGLSLHELGIRMGYPEESARKSAWQFIQKTDDPRVSMLQRFANAMNVPLADLMGYGHDSHILSSGEEVYLIKMPGKKWGISSYDWSWTEGQMLKTIQVFAQTLGWESMEFDTADEAYAFVERQLKKGKAPSRAKPYAKPN